jgi:hypothetical protein
VGELADPLDVFREVIVMAERPRPRTPRRIFVLVAAVGLILGGAAATAVPAGTRLVSFRPVSSLAGGVQPSLEVAGVVVTRPQSGADAEWPSQQPALNAAWGNWPTSIALLDGFLRQWPGYRAAQDKLYAARLSYAASLSQDGHTQEALDQLELAHQLPEEQGEGVAFAQMRHLVESLGSAPSD